MAENNYFSQKAPSEMVFGALNIPLTEMKLTL